MLYRLSSYRGWAAVQSVAVASGYR